MPITRNIRSSRASHQLYSVRPATPPSPLSTLPIHGEPIPVYAPVSPLDSSPEPYQANGKRRSSAGRKSADHIRRPRNAFIIFRSHMYDTLKRDAVKLPGDRNQNQQNELSKMAAKVWKDMKAQEREPFKAIALREKTEHKIMYPNYVYAPSGKAGSGKTKAPKKASSSRRKKLDTPSPSPSPSPSPCASLSPPPPPPPPTLQYEYPFHHAPRRAAAQRASEKIVQMNVPTPPSSSSSASISDAHMDSEPEYVATSDIPHLDLNAPAQANQEFQHSPSEVYTSDYNTHYAPDGTYNNYDNFSPISYNEFQQFHSYSSTNLPTYFFGEECALDNDTYNIPQIMDVYASMSDFPLLCQPDQPNWDTEANVSMGQSDPYSLELDVDAYLNFGQFS